MITTHNHDAKSVHFARGLTAAALIFSIGSIVMIAEHAVVAPSETPSAEMSSMLLAPSEATALSPDGHFAAIAPVAASAGGESADRAIAVSAARAYPELASDATRDEGGHPPSF